jgi:hypothetical protein
VASTSTIEVLDRATWRARADRHARRVDAFVAPHLARREARVKHPVHDFLFTYYSQRPAQLRRWHPGYGVALADAPEREAAVLTLVVAASGVTIAGISAPFWGLVTGLAVRRLQLLGAAPRREG